MRTLLNIVWLVFAGIWLAILYVVAGVLVSLTIIGIPFGGVAFRMASMALWPFGRQVVKKAGRVATRRLTTSSGSSFAAGGLRSRT